MTVHIITYATHEEGMFNKLVNNEYGVKVNVIGWGEKWQGFMHKVQRCNDYIKSFPENDIFIIIDGFDTIINSNNLDNCIKYFTESPYKVMYSKNIKNHNYGLEKVVFDYCRDEDIANCGMYMGYGKFLSILLDDITTLSCKDDQVNVNSVCKKYGFLGIDSHNYIFENMLDKNKPSNAMFIQYPGTLTLSRLIRGLREYPQFFIIHLSLIFITLITLCIHFYCYKILAILLIFIIILFAFSNYSCI